ncbi:MAG TPA: Ig-like domain-containing protein [Candidatus Nanopelagicales bacterium]
MLVTAALAGGLGLSGAPAAWSAPPNQPPIANPDAGTLGAGGSWVLDPVANDTDPEGSTLALDPAVLPAITSGLGTIAPAGGNQVTITATPGFVGTLTASYAVTDGELSSLGTITATVTPPPNTPPVANPDAGSVVAGGQVRLEPLANDSDPDGDALSLVGAALVGGAGSVAVEGSALVVAAAPGASGSLVVSYTVADGRGGNASSTVTVTVNPAVALPNAAPVAGTDRASVRVDRTIRVDVLANDRDPDGDAIALTKVSKPRTGTARRVGASVVAFRAPKRPGTVQVRYTIRDARGATARGLLVITVTPKPKPVAKPKPRVNPGVGARGRKAVEAALARLGLPVGAVNGRYDAATRRAVCTWRGANGRAESRRLPSRAEAKAIVADRGLPAAAPGMVAGVNVSITCQAAYWVSGDSYRRIMPATTGIPSKYPTRLGLHRIFVTHHTWRTSTIYPEARMYKPMQFSGGQALHGSATDRLVKTHPASHGCVRMLHRDIDAMQAGGVGTGTLVRVYGRW